MLNIVKRLGLALGVFVVAYLAAHLGDLFGVAWRVTGPEKNQVLSIGAETFISLFGFTCFLLGIILWETRWWTSSVHTGKLWERVSFFICVCWMYGLAATPNARYGPNPYRWFDNPSDPWCLLPMLAFVPLAVGVLALGVEWVQRHHFYRIGQDQMGR